TPYSMVMSPFGEYSGPSPHEIREGVDRGRKRAIAIFEAEVASLREAVGPSPSLEELAAPSAVRASSKEDGPVFVVHGQGGPAKIEVARLIERAGLRAVILHEQPNAGRTIIEKFEHHGAVAGYAVVLMTPDDVGGPDGGPMQPRARQNVIGE